VRYDDIPGQVFGNQLRLEKFSAEHLANLLYERAALYARHMKDITSSHLKVQEQLFCERINSPQQATRRQMALETLLVRLESDRRRAELDFWKDTQEIRQGLFEKAGAYQAASHRARLLQGIGGYDGKS